MSTGPTRIRCLQQLITALGIAPGIVAGWLVGAWFLGRFSSDLLAFGFSKKGSSMFFCALALWLVAALSLIPAVRTIRRLDITQVVRERSR